MRLRESGSSPKLGAAVASGNTTPSECGRFPPRGHWPRVGFSASTGPPRFSFSAPTTEGRAGSSLPHSIQSTEIQIETVMEMLSVCFGWNRRREPSRFDRRTHLDDFPAFLTFSSSEIWTRWLLGSETL